MKTENQLALDIQSTSDDMCVLEIIFKSEKPKLEKHETKNNALVIAEAYEKLNSVLRVDLYECKLLEKASD